ncbi:MAG: amidohydrolase [Pseudomonadales bacterium]
MIIVTRVAILMTRLLLTVVTIVFTGAARGDIADPYPSTYSPPAATEVVFTNARILVGNGDAIERGYVWLADGEIVAVGAGEPAGTGAGQQVIDVSGSWITPGIIDVHSHLGVYPSPSYAPHSDGNEATSPVTAEVWAEHSVWPQDPQFPLALAGGVTTLQILPGSANLIGGRSVVLKNVSSRTVQGMKYPGAPYGLKMACGENPKRVYGSKGSSPATRMGNMAGYRAAWIKAQDYQRKWQAYEEKLADFEASDKEDKTRPEPPGRDLQSETLVGVLEGEILVHNHCYRADEMANMIDLSREFGYRITTFQHAVESYKIADLLAENNICSAMWADWARFKLESFDGIEENAALVENAGACAIVHSDSAFDIQRLNQEAAKALAAGQRMGLDMGIETAISWITLNAARALGLEDEIGSIEVGKVADIVVWDGNPFSVYTRTKLVLIDGVVRFDRAKGIVPVTDFELGYRTGATQ